MLIGRGDAGDGYSDIRRGSRRGSSGTRGEGTRQVQRDGRGRSRRCTATIGKQAMRYIADSAATCNMMPDADRLINDRLCS